MAESTTDIKAEESVSETQGGDLHRVNRETYFARLQEIDRQNLQRLISAFEATMIKNGRRGALKAVGGTINRPLPRKDIDLTLRLIERENDPKREDFPDHLQYSLADYNIIRELTREIAAKDGNLEIVEETKPVIDEEYQSPSILKNDGSIKIKPKEGTPIEIIRRPSISSTVESEPFVVLSEV